MRHNYWAGALYSPRATRESMHCNCGAHAPQWKIPHAAGKILSAATKTQSNQKKKKKKPTKLEIERSLLNLIMSLWKPTVDII